MHTLRFFLLIVTYLNFLWTTPIHAEWVQPFDAAALSMLETSGDPAILAVEEDTVYLNPNNVSVNENGIFLSTNTNKVLRLLSLAHQGSALYTRICNAEPRESTVWPIIKCRSCGRSFVLTILNSQAECPYCGAKN